MAKGLREGGRRLWGRWGGGGRRASSHAPATPTQLEEQIAPRTTRLVPWSDLDADLAAAVGRVATCRTQVWTLGGTRIAPSKAPPYEVVVARADGAITATNGYAMHQERVPPSVLAPLLRGQDSATYWVHGDYLVQAVVPAIDHRAVFAGHSVRVVLDALFLPWVRERRDAGHEVLLLHGHRGRDDVVATGQAVVGPMQEAGQHAARTHADAALFSWQSEDMAAGRDWAVVLNTRLLYPLLSLHDASPHLWIWLTPTEPARPGVEAAVATLRSESRVSTLMSMMTSWEWVEAMERHVL